MWQRLQHQADLKQAMDRIKEEFGDLKEINHFRMSVLDDEFQILDKLSEGTFGQIYNGASLKEKIGGVPKPVIIKFTQAHEMNDDEFRALKDIQENAVKSDRIKSDDIVKVFTKGKLLIKDPALKEAMER